VLSWGRQFRVLAIVDDFTREPLALVVDSSIRGRWVVRELDALIARRGRPAMIVSDNGTELTSRAVLEWTNRTGPCGTTSRLASQPKTPWSRASSAGSATSA
jgi:putative transposase